MTRWASGKTAAREAAVQIVRVLRQAGHVAYLAGGCVRDALLGLAPKDYDVATSAPPREVRSLFPRSRFVGEAFGVVLVRLHRHDIEVATFRAEWGYEDGRRPTHIEFTDARGDAQRRDFTVNSLFEDPLATDASGRIIDYVGGQADLEARVIRAVGDPDQRFAEDYLRLLRAVRFAARLDFAIEEQTALAIRVHARHLGRISRERIGQEVQGMLTGPRPALAARWTQELGLDGPTLNEDHLEVELATLANLEAGKTEGRKPKSEAPDRRYAVTLAAWMLDRHLPAHFQRAAALGGPAQDAPLSALEAFAQQDLRWRVGRWRTALVLSNDQTADVQATIDLVARAIHWAQLPVAQRKRLLAQPLFAQAQRLLRALSHHAAFAELTQRLEQEAAPLLAEGVAPPPLVTGDDLIAAGLTPGPHFKKLLDEVYDAQLEGRLTGKGQALAWVRASGDAGKG